MYFCYLQHGDDPLICHFLVHVLQMGIIIMYPWTRHCLSFIPRPFLRRVRWDVFLDVLNIVIFSSIVIISHILTKVRMNACLT